MSSGKSEAALLVDGVPVPLLIRRYAAARGYRLRYDAGRGRLLLSMPVRGGMRAALGWAQGQEAWVRGQMAAAPEMRMLRPGALVPIEGKDCLILWNPAQARAPMLTDGELRVGGPEEGVGQRVLRWLRARALATLTRETHAIAAREALQATSIRIGDPRSRWGSCSSGGAIRYSWRLILAPPEVRIATVAHEVAHLLHMDHSPAFHAAHARLLGCDPAPARAWLRVHGADLHHIGA